MPIFFKKTSIPSKTRGNSYSFCFSIFNEKPPSVMPIFDKKKSILSKLSQEDALFSPIFHEKVTALLPIFCQKNVPSPKTHSFHVNYCSKTRLFSQKHNALISFFSNFSLKTPTFMSILFGPKRQLCPNHNTYLKK